MSTLIPEFERQLVERLEGRGAAAGLGLNGAGERHGGRIRAVWSRRRRGLLASGAAVLVAVGGTGTYLATATADRVPGRVTAVSAEERAAVPALGGPAVPIPPFVKRSFAGIGGSDNLTGGTTNASLARPLLAHYPGAPTAWVAPAHHGVCLAVPDSVHSMGVTCASTTDIVERGLATSIYGATTAGKMYTHGIEVGVGGKDNRGRLADGSYVRSVADGR